MPNILTNLELTELSLVDRPANPEARAPIFKADSRKGENEMEKELMEKLSAEMLAKLKPYMDKGMSEEEALQAYNEDMKKSADDAEALQAENERLRKGLIENGFIIKAETIEKKEEKTVELIEVDGEQIAKSEIPEVILKRLEADAKEREENRIAKMAEEKLPNWKPEVAQALLKFDLEDAIIEALIAADNLFFAAAEEFGKSDKNGDMKSPQDELDALVKAHAEEHNVTKQQAYAAVSKTKEGKALINKTYEKED